MDRIEAVEIPFYDIGIVPGAAVQVIVARPVVAADAESAPEGVSSLSTDQHIVDKIPEQ